MVTRMARTKVSGRKKTVRPRAKSPRALRKSRGGAWYSKMFKKRAVKQAPVVLTNTEDVDPDHLAYDPLDDRHTAYLTSKLLR